LFIMLSFACDHIRSTFTCGTKQENKPTRSIRWGFQRLIIFWLSTCNNQLFQMSNLAIYEWDWLLNNWWFKGHFLWPFFSPFALKNLRSWLCLIWTTIPFVYAMTIYQSPWA
jgi:hypothetical protein